MTRKEIASSLGLKLKQIQEIFNKSGAQMAEILYCDRVSYFRNEKGQNIPNIFTIYNLATQLDISLNWFLLDEGPMYIREIASVKDVESVSRPLTEDLKELFEHMERLPLLRHDILLRFQQFKEEHPLMVEKAMKE
jgi:transcriptional regulator with XRE-family HTH domain